VAVVTTTAGGATMVVDPLASRGITVEPPTRETLARIKAATGVEVAPARLVDLTLAGVRYDVMKAALDILTTAPEFDLVVVVVGSSARFYPDLAVKPIIDSAGAATPIAAYLVPEAPQALAALSHAGVPSFHTPEACADAVAAALRRRTPTARTEPLRTMPAASHMLDEHEAYQRLRQLGITCAPSVVLDADISQLPTLPFSYPVAVKALSATIAHKTEAGGVALEIADGEAFVAAIRRIRDSVAERTGTRIDQVLVQAMAAGLGEALVGYRVDSDVGPLVMVAAGGVYTEIYRDRALRLAPVDLTTAHEMIAEVRGLIPLTGYRGKPKGDLAALAQAIVALSQLADDTAVIEAEINPLIVRPEGQGVVAVDALVRLAGKA
jgi:acyl-CoA synthetase (NDP forming)